MKTNGKDARKMGRLLASVSIAAIIGATDFALAQSQIDEIIVTARKREESLQDAPISIQAFTADGLERRNVTDSSQIAEFTPNLRFDRAAAIGGSNSSAVVYIRGIGQDTAIPTIDLGVGTYVDGVYLARSVGSVLDLVDVERIEVLRGPQGTLFGRNTIGGAINITSKKPTDEFEADLSTHYGSDELINVLGRVNVPIVEGLLAARASMMYRNRDGYVFRPDGTDLGDEDTFAARLAVRLTPTAPVSFDFSLDYTNSESNGAPFVLTEVVETAAFPQFNNAFIAPPGQCFFGPGGPPSPIGNLNCFNPQFVDSSLNTDFGTLEPQDDLEIWGLAFTGEWEISDNITAKSITSYRDTASRFRIDQDHSPLLIAHVDTTFEQEQFSQEVQLTGDFFGDRLNGILGFYYFFEEGVTFETVSFSPVVFQSGGEFDNTSLAFFGQSTFDITDRLNVTAGVRYTDDTKRFTPDTFVTSNNNALVPAPLLGFGVGQVPPSPPSGFLLLPASEAEVDFEEVTFLANVSYDVTEDLTTYFTFSQGFKSGGFTQRVFPPEAEVPSFEPETVDVFEVGVKSEAFDRRLRINGAVFYTDYEDLQFVVQDVSVAPVVRNAASATIKGFEIDMTAIPMEGLLIEAGVGFVDAEYDDVDVGTGVTTANELVKTPKWSSSLGVSYRIPVAGASSITPRVDWSYSGSYFNNAINSPQIFQESYNIVNVGLTYENDDLGLTLSAIGKNLSDEQFISAGFSDTVNLGTSEAVFDRGRQWVLTAKKTF